MFRNQDMVAFMATESIHLMVIQIQELTLRGAYLVLSRVHKGIYMKSFSVFVSSFLLILLICQIEFSASVWQQVRRRNLNRYDKSGPHIIEPWFDTQRRTDIESKIREFLWTHWSQQQLGHLVVSKYSKEGDLIIYNFYLEPDKNGNWYIQVMINRHLSTFGNSRKNYKETEKYNIYTVEQSQTRRARDEEETIKIKSYKLLLKDQKGRVRIEL